MRTFVGLILIVGTGLAIAFSGTSALDAVAEQSVASPDDVSTPFYIPPKKYAPRARVGGELRGTEGKDPEIVALVPDHVALTMKPTPVLNWFLSKPTTYPIIFTLNAVQQVQPIYEKPLPTPKQGGVQSIDLKALGITLEPNVQYRWYVSARRNSDSHSNDIVAGGVIERCEINDCLITIGPITTCDHQSVLINAKNGLWYDAMACVCSLIDARPGEPSLRRLRAQLLKDIGLHGVAEWDLRSIQSALY